VTTTLPGARLEQREGDIAALETATPTTIFGKGSAKNERAARLISRAALPGFVLQ